MEAPMAEEPQDAKFDTSDLETTAAETPKAKRKRAEAKVEPAPKSSGAARPLPGVHERPKKGRKASSEGKLNATASGEIGVASDVEESLQELRDIQKARVQEEEEAEWETTIAAAKKRAAEEEEKANTVEIEAEPMSDAEREDLEWDKKIGEAKLREELKANREAPVSEDMRAAHENLDRKSDAEVDAEGYRRIGMKQVAEDASSKLYEIRKKKEAKEAAKKDIIAPSGFRASEEAWFKQGEEDEARQMAEARATIERGGKGELMVETTEDWAANVADAGKLLKGGDLSPRDFNLGDYEYLLKERIRIDTELEHAGWWQARKLRKDLEKIMKGGYQAPGSQGLSHYEGLLLQAKSGEGAMKADARDKAEKNRKPSFWERLRMDKGR
jgi:hypothetical protein